MPDQGDPVTLDAEEIDTLARSPRARTGAAEGAPVVTGSDSIDAASSAAVRDLTPSAHVLRADASGAVLETLTPETSS